jgi:glycosyltransferase involved in cell wall biosynthesis
MSIPELSPAISVVIPVYNGAAFLAEAVASVRAQTRQPRQIIIVDDGSTDATPQVARALGADLEYIRQENRGPSAARNRGLQAVRGEFVGFLDVDDLWPADKLAVQLDYLEKHPGQDVVLGLTQPFEEPGAHRQLYNFANGCDVNPPLLFLIGAALFRRPVFAKVGGFDAGKRYSEDLDWFIRAREKGIQLESLPRTTLIKRCHENNMTRGKKISQMSVASTVRESLLRRRRADGTVTPLGQVPPSP